jgi:hypothetical protein
MTQGSALGPHRITRFLGEFEGCGERHLPATMQAYAMRGTPTVVLIDAKGLVRRHVFGSYTDLQMGHDIGQLIAEAEARSQHTGTEPATMPAASRRMRRCRRRESSLR